MSYLIKYTETINPLKTIISTDILYLLLPYEELNIFIPTGSLSQVPFLQGSMAISNLETLALRRHRS